MAESINDIVKRGSIFIPNDNLRLYIKRLQSNGAYETDWLNISEYVIDWGSIEVGFTDGVFVGEFKEFETSITLNNNRRLFNDENTSESIFYGYRTRFKTKFKIGR